MINLNFKSEILFKFLLIQQKFNKRKLFKHLEKVTLLKRIKDKREKKKKRVLSSVFLIRKKKLQKY